jgi:hypothetical protein
MKRVMFPLLALVASGICAGALHAGEAEKAAASKFLESQTALNEGILGEQALKMRMLRQDVGNMTLNVEKGEYEGKVCYVLTLKGHIEFGAASEVEGKSYIAPDLSLLHSEETEKTNGELSKQELYELKDGVLNISIKNPKDEDESAREQSFKVTPERGLLIGQAEMLVTMLLPREAGKKYEFTRWNDDSGKTYPMTVELVGNEDHNGKPAFKIVEHDKTFDKDESGQYVGTDVDSKLWFDGHKLVRMEAAEGFTLETGEAPKLTPITREMVDKQDNPACVAAGFYMGANQKDKALLAKLLNMTKIFRPTIDKNPRFKNNTNEEKDQIAELYGEQMLKNMTKPDPEGKTDEQKAREKAVMKMLLHTEFFVTEEKNDVRTVRLSDDAARMFGKTQFTLEKTSDGKWEITGIGQVPEKEDNAEPEDGDGDKGDDEGDDEDGF